MATMVSSLEIQHTEGVCAAMDRFRSATANNKPKYAVESCTGSSGAGGEYFDVKHNSVPRICQFWHKYLLHCIFSYANKIHVCSK